MSRSKLFNMIKSRGTQPNGRNMFDLSNRHAYSMKAGVITPIKAIHTIPDDYLDVDVSDFSQTFPMHTAAFMRGRKEIAAYFVPYNSIWHNFNQYMATREDPDSVLLQKQGIKGEPRFYLWRSLYRVAVDHFLVLATLKYWLRAYAIFDWYTNRNFGAVDIKDFPDYWYNYIYNTVVNNPIDSSTASLMTIRSFLRTYGVASYMCHFNTNFVGINELANRFYTIAGYHGSNGDHYYGNAYYDYLYGTTTVADIYMDVVGNLAWQGIVTKFDMLGYGNLFPQFGTAIARLEEIFGSITFPLHTDMDTQEKRDEWLRSYTVLFNNIMCDLVIDIKKISLTNVSIVQGVDRVVTDVIGDEVTVSPYPLYAYNRVFYDMFRNSYYDLNYDVRNYNCDNTYAQNTSPIIPQNEIPSRFYKLECHQWKKDMFTGVLPDTQFGAVSTVSFDGVTDTDRGQWQGSNPVFLRGAAVQTSGVSNDLVATGDSSGTPIYHAHEFASTFDVMALRRAECLQQYRMDLLRAGNRTSDIFKQIYGANPKSELDESPYFIEVMGNDIFVDPVVSTASTGSEVNGSLGDIAARGLISGNNMHFKFSTKDFGVVIFVAYIVPESMYNSYRIDPHLMNLEPEEHFIPQFQNLGFEPVFGEWLNQGTDTERKTVRGYAPRYLEFKTDVDMAHGVFTSKYFANLGEAEQDNAYVGSLSHWVVTRTDMQNSKALALSNFYVNPRILDSVFLQAADELPDSDQFICYTSIGVKAVRQLSELGLPRFC